MLRIQICYSRDLRQFQLLSEQFLALEETIPKSSVLFVGPCSKRPICTTQAYTMFCSALHQSLIIENPKSEGRNPLFTNIYIYIYLHYFLFYQELNSLASPLSTIFSYRAESSLLS